MSRSSISPLKQKSSSKKRGWETRILKMRVRSGNGEDRVVGLRGSPIQNRRMLIIILQACILLHAPCKTKTLWTSHTGAIKVQVTRNTRQYGGQGEACTGEHCKGVDAGEQEQSTTDMPDVFQPLPLIAKHLLERVALRSHLPLCES